MTLHTPLTALPHPDHPANPEFTGRCWMPTPTAVATNATAANPPGRGQPLVALAMKDKT